MEKLKMQTTNIADENYKKLAEMFPNAVTETINEDGEVVRAIDKDVLMQEISCSVVEGRQERYQFTWPDKKKAVLLANTPINKTLRPCREESVGKDGTSGGFDSENLYVEGDNLEVLKMLRNTYMGKVKLIYIDPPYNTGGDFVYSDNFSQDMDEYTGKSGQYDEEGNRLVRNLETNGRFHTDWLNMMYPRLRIAKELLTVDGVIFISINECEIENLKKLCNEVFSENNLIGCFCWKTDGNFDNQAKIKVCHEYILAYAKNERYFPAPPVIDPNIPSTSKLFREEIRNTIIKNGPKNPPTEVVLPKGFPCDIVTGKIIVKSIKWPQYNDDLEINDFKLSKKVTALSGWSSNAQLIKFIENGFEPVLDSKGQETRFILTKTGAIEAIKKRTFISHVVSVLEKLGGTQKATVDLGELGELFDYPKPVGLIKYLCSMVDKEEEIVVMDFFSGSATTAHAVMQLNAEDGGHRKFIMVQWPEKTDEKSEAYKAGYKNICEIGKERIRRAGAKIKEDSPLTTQNLDVGFRVLKCDSSNMKEVYYAPEEYSRNFMDMLEDNIEPDRTSEDLLFQVMLELGIELSSEIKESTIEDKRVFSVANDYLIACFDKDVTEQVITEIAKKEPSYFVMRDSSMANDSVAANFEQIFDTYSSATIRKVL